MMNLIVRVVKALRQILAPRLPVTDNVLSSRRRTATRQSRCQSSPRRRSTAEAEDRDEFRFAPELFETRVEVIAELSERGFDWLSHYSSVDPIHDCYGIEVCGIHDRDDARAIQRILMEMFPDWRPG